MAIFITHLPIRTNPLRCSGPVTLVAYFVIWHQPPWLLISPFGVGHLGRPFYHLALATLVAHFAIWRRPPWSPISPFGAGHLGRPFYHLALATLVAYFAMRDPSPLLLTSSFEAGHLGRPFYHLALATLVAHFAIWRWPLWSLISLSSPFNLPNLPTVSA